MLAARSPLAAAGAVGCIDGPLLAVTCPEVTWVDAMRPVMMAVAAAKCGVLAWLGWTTLLLGLLLCMLGGCC